MGNVGLGVRELNQRDARLHSSAAMKFDSVLLGGISKFRTGNQKVRVQT